MKARCISKSHIAHSPPYVREIWDYLLREANHAEVKYDGFIIKRGQLFRSYRQIRKGLSWKVGYRTERYNENQMKRGMKHLMKHLMIELTRQPRGNIITIVNYDFYQNPKNYERTNDRTNERTDGDPMVIQSGPAINKNDKNIKNDKNKKAMDPFSYTSENSVLNTPDFRERWKKWDKFRKEKKAPLTPTMVESQIKKMEEWGHDRSIAAIEHTIFKGWQGLREPETEATNDPYRQLTTEEHLERSRQLEIENEKSSNERAMRAANTARDG